MTDLIIGMGEVGSTLYDLLSEREIDVQGFDKVREKCKMSGLISRPEFCTYLYSLQ